MDLKALGKRIQELRRSAGLSQEELAAAAGVGRNTLQRIEGGKGNPTAEILKAVGSALSTDLNGDGAVELARTAGFRDAADFLSKFAGAPLHIQKIVLMIVYKDVNFLKDVPSRVVQDATKLLKALSVL